MLCDIINLQEVIEMIVKYTQPNEVTTEAYAEVNSLHTLMGADGKLCGYLRLQTDKGHSVTVQAMALADVDRLFYALHKNGYADLDRYSIRVVDAPCKPCK